MPRRRLALPPRMAAFSSPERGRRRMCCRSFCGLPQGQSLPNRIRSAPKARTRETKASSESICRSSGSASSRGVSEPREKDVSASSSCTCSQQRQHELHRTDLPQCAARLFRRAAGTAGEADVIVTTMRPSAPARSRMRRYLGSSKSVF